MMDKIKENLVAQARANLAAQLKENLEQGARALDIGEMQVKEIQRYHGQIGLSTEEYEQLLLMWNEIRREMPSFEPLLLPLIARAENLLRQIEEVNRMPVEDSLTLQLVLKRMPGREMPETLIEGLIRTLVENEDTRQIIKQALRAQRRKDATFPSSERVKAS